MSEETTVLFLAEHRERGLRQAFERNAYKLGQQVDNYTEQHERAREILGALPHGHTTRTLCQLAKNAVECAHGRRRRIERMGRELKHTHVCLDLITTGFLAAIEQLTEEQARVRELEAELVKARQETHEVLQGSYLPGCAIPEAGNDQEATWYQGAYRGYQAARIMHDEAWTPDWTERAPE